MDTHFSATPAFPANGAIRPYAPVTTNGASQASGGSISPTILGTGSTAGLLDSLGIGSSGAGSSGIGSSGGSGSSLVNALQGLAQMLLGGGSSGGAGSGFTLSLPQYQPMAKPNEHDTRDIAPSPAGGGGDD